MRQTIIILMLIPVLLTLGCDLGDRKVRKYIIENGTQHNLTIDVYQYNYFHKTLSISGKGIIFEHRLNNEQDTPTALEALNADSVVITFDNKRRQIYTYSLASNRYVQVPDTNYRNILNDAIYTAENDELYRFIFSEEDYNKAEEF